VSAETVCFEEQIANQIVIDLEKCTLVKDELDIYKAVEGEQAVQLNLLKELDKVKSEEILICKETISKFSGLVDAQKDFCKKALDASRPGFFESAVRSSWLFAIGVVLGLLLF
jgi:hypothetical protein